MPISLDDINSAGETVTNLTATVAELAIFMPIPTPALGDVFVAAAFDSLIGFFGSLDVEVDASGLFSPGFGTVAL